MEAKVFITGWKIQIFKSLIASKPVYVTTMKHLPQEILEQCIRISFGMENGAKIKHCTPTGDYTDGELKDVDLVSKFTSLKFIWKTFIHGLQLQIIF